MADFPDNVFNGSIEDLNNIVNSTIADIPLKQGEITKEELQKALSTYPVLVKTPLPKPSEMVVENRQLCLTLKENATNKFDLFMCGGKGNDDTYLWYPVAKDDELGNYVPTTRKIANIDLTKDITTKALKTALGIEIIEPDYTNMLDIAGYTKGVYLSSSGEKVDENSYTTGYIPCSGTCTVYLKNITMPDESSHGNRIACYDSNKNLISGTCFSITSSLTALAPKFNESGNLTQFDISYDNMAYIRISAWHIDGNSIITVNEEITESTTDNSQTDFIPDYWKPHLAEKVDKIRQTLESVGSKKSSFIWYTDIHWNYGAQISPILLKYLFEHTPINKTNFGGDVVNDEGDVSTENGRKTMSYLWDWRNAIRDLPNHHSVVGNHDDGNATNNLFDDNYIYAYLMSSEENEFIVRGGDFYYYIDDKSENTRYLYLDTAYKGVDDEQLEFIQKALKSTPNGYHIIAIAHTWYQPNYDQYDVKPIPIAGFDTNAVKVITELDNYNSRIGEYANCDGWVEFCIGGHVHIDYDGATNAGIPIILTETDSYHNRSGLDNTQGTINEASISAIVADYENHRVNIIRVGRGNDRAVEYDGLDLLNISPKDEIATTWYVDNIVDSVNSALDEIHTYAQGIISGGVDE